MAGRLRSLSCLESSECTAIFFSNSVFKASQEPLPYPSFSRRKSKGVAVRRLRIDSARRPRNFFSSGSRLDRVTHWQSGLKGHGVTYRVFGELGKRDFRLRASSDRPAKENDDSFQNSGDGSGKSGEESKGAEEKESDAASRRPIDPWVEKSAKAIDSELDISTSKIVEDLVFVWHRTLDVLNAWKIAILGIPNQIETLKEKARPSWQEFEDWNSISLWKDIKRWDSVRIGVALVYFFFAFSFARTVHKSFFSPFRPSAITAASEQFLDLAIQEPTPQNIMKMKKMIWRDTKPDWLVAKRYVMDPESGEYKLDESFVGDKAWKEDIEEVIEKEDSDEKALDKVKRPWREKLVAWTLAMEEEMEKENNIAPLSKIEVSIDWDKVKKEFEENDRKDLNEMLQRERWCSFWVEKEWWKFRPSLPYTWLLTAIENQEIESVVYSEDLRRLYVAVKEGFPSEFVVEIPVDPYLYESLRMNRVAIGWVRRNPFFFLRGVIILLPSLVILAFIANIQTNLLYTMREKVRDLMLMNRSNLIMPNDPELTTMTTYDDVVMGEGVWDVVNEMLSYMSDPMKYLSKKAKLPRGVLISGPPGTGKTLLARAIARESGLPFVFASGAEFIQSNKGEGRLSIYELFYTARSMAPSFIFIDEIDALAGKSVMDDPTRKEIFDQFLLELDGEPEETDVDRFSMRQAVILLAATNRPEDLHPEFLKPGRIDRELYIRAPGEEERIKIFKVHSKDRTMAADVDFSKLAFRTTGFTGADIRNLVNEAGIIAIRKGNIEITQEDVAEALDKQLFEGLGISQTDEEEREFLKNIPIETKKLLAVHEAGHILLAHLFPKFDLHAFSHILPGGNEKGLSVFYPREDMLMKGYANVGYLRMQMVVSHGGRCAEKLIFGPDEITEAGTDDLNFISRLAREIACSPANPRMGLMPMTFHEVMEPPVKAEIVNLIPNRWSRKGTQIANFSVPLSELFTREVTRHVEETEAFAIEALEKNKHILLYLVDHLMERFKIRGTEAENLVKSMNPVMLPNFLEDSSEENEDNIENKLDPERAGRYEYLNVYPAPLHRS